MVKGDYDMTKAQFDEMKEAVLGSGKFADGEKFIFFVRGESVIIQREEGMREGWYLMQEYQLDDNGEPYLCSEWPER